MGFESVSINSVMPTWRWGDCELFWLLVVVAWVYCPGYALRRLLVWKLGRRAERTAVSLLCGIVGMSAVYWLVLLSGIDVSVAGRFILAGCVLGFVFFLWASRKQKRTANGSLRASIERRLRRSTKSEWLGYALIVACAAYYVARTAPLFDYHFGGLRLYGAAHQDKMTSVMPCAGLRYDAPPDNLRFAGTKFLNHYFPHLAAAALEHVADIKYLDGYWFHLPMLAIVVNGLAILGFARRVLKSYAAGCVGVLLYGLLQATPNLKPLDITPALALMSLTALDRFNAARRKRWAAACVVMVGAMACYEVFHAATIVAALGLWGVINIAIELRRRRPLRYERLAIPAAAAVAMFGALQAMNLGYRAARPEIVLNNTFGDSYRHEWLDRAKVDDAAGRSLATFYAWNRNKADAEGVKPAWYQRAVGRATFGIGLVAYVYARFGLWATFGWWHLARNRRCRLRPSEQVVLAATIVGFSAPWFVDFGMHGGGQWWSSPNLYRPTHFSAWLAGALGAGVILQALREPRRLRSWLGGAVAAYAVWSSLDEHRPPHNYFDVPQSQLEAMAYLRTHPELRNETTVHPWFDCSIRNVEDGSEEYLHKRFFMLVSELAGQSCYCEGRAEYLYWNGLIPHDEIERRIRLRRRFYEGASDAEIAEVLDDGVRIVIADKEHPPPKVVAEQWTKVFERSGVRIYRRDGISSRDDR